LKIYKSLGFSVKDIDGKRVKVDDPRLDPIWKKAGELKIPVIIHTADPKPFWDPMDSMNERWLELATHPGRKRSNTDPAPWDTLMAEQHRLFKNHPGTTFIAAGEKSILEMIKSLLHDAGGAAVWEFGNEPATANVAKLCSNFLIISAIESMAEGINLAKRSGLDATTWMNMLTQSLFAAPIYINYGNILLKELYQPAGFTLRLGLKDANLIVQQAREAKAKMPIGELMQQRLNESVANGLAEHDWTAVALMLK